MYTEEEMHQLMDDYQDWLFHTRGEALTFREWFNQIKK